MKCNNLKNAGALTFALLVSIVSVSAQKLSDVQEGNLLVSKINVDGNATDWTIPLKAFNKSTGLSYTIANDDKKLYLIIQAIDVNTTRKILMGGITFGINADGKKRSKELLSLTYPMITRNSRRAAMGGGSQRSMGSFQTMTQEQRDSLQNAFGQKQLATAKDIKIFGFKNVTDTLVSIYNEYSVKAMATLDEKGTYTYEIGIPLELLPIDINQEFGYNIKVNGLQMNGFGGGGNRGNGGGRRGSVDFQDLITPTDLWGKYTLAK
ncbi:MAG TPA: hypothetical protein VFM79_10385 [Pelobium sp.]|nr:hypothetical protein [Pelobium sp.]